MKKVNGFFEKYEVALWQLIAAIWFYTEYFFEVKSDSLLGAGFFWTFLAVLEFIRIKIKKK